MDWYDLLTHDPGCDLAYIRDFVHPDTVCSCYQAVIDEHTQPEPAEPEWLSLLISTTTARMLGRRESWTPWYAVKAPPYYSTGALRITRPSGKLFS